MSADNWGKCPKCGEGDDNKFICKRRQERVCDGHNGIPLREDYEIGIYEKEFFISYRGECQSCGFLKRFEHSEFTG